MSSERLQTSKGIDLRLCCVSLSQLLNLSGLPQALLQEGLGNPSRLGFSIRKKIERVCFENRKTLAQDFEILHSLPVLWGIVASLSNRNTERLCDGSHSSLPTATHTLFAKAFLRKISFNLNSEGQNSLQTKLRTRWFSFWKFKSDNQLRGLF